MTNSTNKPTTLFWIISVIALIWNAMGANAYIQQAYNTESYQAMYTPEQIEIANNVPAWVTAMFAIAVFGATLGSIFLLLRKKIANSIFVISFLAVAIQMSYVFLLGGMGEEYYGAGGMIMPIMIIVIAIFLVWYSKKATTKGWLS
ncbi:MAG: hypothetical protein P8K77_04815 [Polaribacter sp.]|nr:hypothetical protein [Polaribacter sp.]